LSGHRDDLDNLSNVLVFHRKIPLSFIEKVVLDFMKKCIEISDVGAFVFDEGANSCLIQHC
jgi:hypothetical protein